MDITGYFLSSFARLLKFSARLLKRLRNSARAIFSVLSPFIPPLFFLTHIPITQFPTNINTWTEGATGGVGKRVVAKLLQAGKHVRALVRDASKAQELLVRGNVCVRVCVCLCMCVCAVASAVLGATDTQELLVIICDMSRVGQNHIYTVYIRYFWQGNHQIYGHIRCIYTVLANPRYECSVLQQRCHTPGV